MLPLDLVIQSAVFRLLQRKLRCVNSRSHALQISAIDIFYASVQPIIKLNPQFASRPMHTKLSKFLRRILPSLALLFTCEDGSEHIFKHVSISGEKFLVKLNESCSIRSPLPRGLS